VSAAPAQACSPQRSSRVDRDSPAVGAQRQRNLQLPGSRLRDNFGPTSGQQACSVQPFGSWETRRRGDVPQFTSLPGFPPAFTSAQSFSASDLTLTEMESTSENDFECFASTGVNAPGTMLPN